MSYSFDFSGEHPIFVVYRIYGLLLLIVFLFFYPLAIYLILFKSPPPMRIYRIFLSIVTTADFVYTFSYGFLFLPIPVFPAIGAVSLGVAGLLGQNAVLASFLLVILATIATIFAQCYSLLYRFTVFNSSFKLSNWFNKTSTHMFFSGYVTVAGIVITCGLGWLHEDEEVSSKIPLI
ncbi:hypothetical protein FO519_007483 [Halicephalobus sp. NKZ332]|nr:hypothetical protein FO519_007483 [Halicephalobus sp. NKZ332]